MGHGARFAVGHRSGPRISYLKSPCDVSSYWSLSRLDVWGVKFIGPVV